jgi:hypothetical protein
MALHKIGSLVKIAAAGVTLEDIVVEKPQAEQKVIEPRNAEFLYFRARAISAGDQGAEKGVPNPNGNGDYFPRRELEASYSTFAGRNLFLNHESDHPVKSIGKILDAYPVEDPETGEYYIECLAKIDRKLHPEISRKVETGELNTVSMGCSCESSMCSVCGTVIHTDDDQKCAHLEPSGILKKHIAEVDIPEYGIQKGADTLAFSINSGLVFNELSIVNVPADASAFIKGIIASNLKNKISKNASLDATEQSHLKTILASLDDETKKKIQADFCGCTVPKEESKMSDKVTPTAENSNPSALSKLNALEYIEFAKWMEKKLEKTAEVPVKVEPVKTDETILDKAIAAVKNSPLGKVFSTAVKKEIEKVSKGGVEKAASTDVRAEFTKNEDFKKSSWALYQGDKQILKASVENLWDEDQLADEKYRSWTASASYGDKLVETFKKVGFAKTAEILGLGFKVAEKEKHLKTETTVSKPEGSFVKPGKETKEDKAADKTQDALHKADETEVGAHLESSKPESEKKEAAVEKKADFPGAEPAVEEPGMKVEEVPVDQKPEDAPIPPAKPGEAPMEAPKSAFDKLDDGIVIAEGMTAKKDPKTQEIVVTDAAGTEAKRMPDGFGLDVPSVMKLLQSILGVSEKKDEMAPATPEAPAAEEPKMEGPTPVEEKPAEVSKEEAYASHEKAAITKKAEELDKKEAALKAQEAEINAKKFSSLLQARTEHCKTVVALMLQKDMVNIEQSEIEVFIKGGSTLLDAREAALKKAVNKQVKTLLAMDDISLKSFEDGVKNVKIRKEASSRLANPLHLNYTASEDHEVDDIFNSMGNGGGLK